MNKEKCFKISSNELFLEHVLVEYNKTPIYFVCKDDNEVYYIVLCTDIDEEKYIIVETKIENIVNVFKQKMTMRDIIVNEKKCWEIIAGDDIAADTCNQLNTEDINKEDLPYDNAYFRVSSIGHQEYFEKLKNIIISDKSQWNIMNSCNNNIANELDIEIAYDHTKVNEFTEINELKININRPINNKKFKLYFSTDFTEDCIKADYVIYKLSQSELILSQNNNLLAA